MLNKRATQCNCLRKAIKDISQESLQSTDTIINVHRDFSSDINLVRERSISSTDRSASEPNIYYAVNYDDICGPWPSPDHPSFQSYDDTTIEPVLCTWKFITAQDMQCIKQNLSDKRAVQLLFERKLSDKLILKNESKKLYLNLAWKIFEYMRDDGYSAKGISSVLGLFHLTHRFFLSHSWRSADETFSFFKEGLDLHAFLKLPECDVVFNFLECDKILGMFWSLYITRLELVRLICTPKYNLTFKMKNCIFCKNRNTLM